MGIFGSDTLDYEPRGDYVTAGRVAKVDGLLRDGEQVQYLTRGSTVDVQEGGDNTSLFGDDRSRKSGTRGWVRAAFTADRVIIKIPQILGTDDRSIPYNNITTVDLDTGLVKKRITVQTPAATYHIEADDPGKDEVRAAVEFARTQSQTPAQDSGGNTDPLDQLEQLKDLHERGVVSDDEFERKKQDLLDDL